MSFDFKAALESYRRDGYLLLDRFVPPALLSELQQTTDDFINRATAGQLAGDTFDVVEAPGGGKRLRRIVDPEKVSPVYDRLVRDDRLLDLVQMLLGGGGVRFDHAKLNFKPPQLKKAEILWHQDWAFYPQTNDDMLAVGVLLEDCNAENAPLTVIPGSHRGPVYDHHFNGEFAGGIAADLPPDLLATACYLTAPAGSISVHHVRTLHTSGANRGDRDRPLLLLNYVAADAFPIFHKYEWDEFNSRLLRGEPTNIARVTDVSVRIPLPAPLPDDRYTSVSLFQLQEKIDAVPPAANYIN